MARISTPNPFLFLAATPAGRRKVGLRQARSERALADILRKDRLVLLKTWRLPAIFAAEPKLKLKDQVELNTQLSMLLSRGVPLVEALEVTQTVVTPAMQPVVEQMREMVSGGQSFADACQKVGVFDHITISVYRAAERTGDLAGAATQLAQTARRQQAIAGKVGTVMLYPMVVLSIAMIAATVLLVFVVPRIGEALSGNGIKMPVYTQILVTIGNFIKAQWMWIVLFILSAITLLVIARKQVGRVFAIIARKLPVLRGVILIQESARFFSVMAALTHSGVPLADALGTALQAVRHPRLHAQLRQLRTKLVEGSVLQSLIDKVDALPLATRRLLMAAERAGDLDSAFDSLAKDMADELNLRTDRLMALLEPAVIVVMFLIIGSIVMALMLPMLTMTNQIM